MKIWKIVRDTDYETSCDIFTDEATAQAAFESEIQFYRDRYGDENDRGPEDPDEVMEWAESRGCIDLVRLEPDEIKLPPVYEAGPELLTALAEADSYLQGWYDDDMQEGMDELQSVVESAIAKAKGEVPQPWALQAAASDMLAALHEIRDSLHPEDFGNDELYADIFEIIDKTIAKAEGRNG